MSKESTPEDLKALQALYLTEEAPWLQKKIRMNFCVGRNDWYVTEYGPGDRIFFGCAIVNDDYQNVEWSYIGLDELMNVRTINGMEVDSDSYWIPGKAGEIDKMRRTNRE